MTGRWFSPGTPVFSTNKTDRHDMTEILLKVVLSTIKPTNQSLTFVTMVNFPHNPVITVFYNLRFLFFFKIAGIITLPFDVIKTHRQIELGDVITGN